MNFGFSKRRKIASGGHGFVFEASDSNGVCVAMKVTNCDDPHTARELEAMKVLACNPHKNVVCYVADPYTDTSKRTYQLYELCKEDLLTQVERKITGVMVEAEAQKVFKQVLEGLIHCHNNDIFHFDLKPENILATADDEYKLADFGSARVGALQKGYAGGTTSYASPESLTSLVVNPEKADVWSLGVCMFAVTQGVFPWSVAHVECLDFTKWKALCKLDNSRDMRQFLKESCLFSISDTFLDVLLKMLHCNVSSRATLSQLRTHEWFK